MFTEERIKSMVKFIETNKRATIHELHKKFGKGL